MIGIMRYNSGHNHNEKNPPLYFSTKNCIFRYLAHMKLDKSVINHDIFVVG